MHRTTVTLRDDLVKKLTRLAEQSNRSTPNLIETILLHYMEESLYLDEFEMEDIRRDKSLKRSITQGISDYKARRGKFV